jgi:hypothetical protein
MLLVGFEVETQLKKHQMFTEGGSRKENSNWKTAWLCALIHEGGV